MCGGGSRCLGSASDPPCAPEVCVVLVVSAARDTSGKNTITHLNVVLVIVSEASAWEHV